MSKNKKLFLNYGLFLLMLIVLISGCSGSNSKPTTPGLSPEPTPTPGDFGLFQLKTLEEINFARSNPSGYAETRLKSYYDANTDNGAYNDLKSRSIVNKLELQSQLCKAAMKYAQYLAQNNTWGHYANGSPNDRCQAEGYHYWSGENIAAGTFDYLNAELDPGKAAIQFVLMLIIDQGIPGVGHRNNIMNNGHKKIGIGFFRDTSSQCIHYTVQDFGSI